MTFARQEGKRRATYLVCWVLVAGKVPGEDLGWAAGRRAAAVALNPVLHVG